MNYFDVLYFVTISLLKIFIVSPCTCMYCYLRITGVIYCIALQRLSIVLLCVMLPLYYRGYVTAELCYCIVLYYRGYLLYCIVLQRLCNSRVMFQSDTV